MTKAASETRRAQRLLLEALRAPERLPGLPPADWDLLLRVARRARVLGRLESDLARAGLLGDIPARAAAHLRAARNVRLCESSTASDTSLSSSDFASA